MTQSHPGVFTSLHESGLVGNSDAHILALFSASMTGVFVATNCTSVGQPLSQNKLHILRDNNFACKIPLRGDSCESNRGCQTDR